MSMSGNEWCKFRVKFMGKSLAKLHRHDMIHIYIEMKEGEFMPSIKPVSALKNYTSIVNEVTYGNRVYFTKNGHGTCALVDMAELDELDKQKALLQLMTKLAEAKVSVREEGTISADDLEKELGL